MKARTAQGSARTAPVTVGGVVHHVAGAQAAIVRDGWILLQLRPWPPGWELPGGHLDPGEDAAACAVREAREETGLEVRVLGLVGVYRWQGLRRTADAVYAVEPVGGSWRRSIEAVAARWVRPERPPRTVFPWYRRRLLDVPDVLNGAPPVARFQSVTIRTVLFFGSSWAGAVVDAARRSRR